MKTIKRELRDLRFNNLCPCFILSGLVKSWLVPGTIRFPGQIHPIIIWRSLYLYDCSGIWAKGRLIAAALGSSW